MKLSKLADKELLISPEAYSPQALLNPYAS